MIQINTTLGSPYESEPTPVGITGFETAAGAVASPIGPTPDAMRFPKGRREDQRRRGVEERTERAREELDDAGSHRQMFDGRFRGRERIFDLPRPIYIDDKPVVRVVVKQGIDEEVLAQLRENPTLEEPVFGVDPRWRGRIGLTVITGDERSAMMKIGSLFQSQVILE